MAKFIWTSYGSNNTILSTAMDALAVDAQVLSTNLDNSTALDLYGDAELSLASYASTGAAPFVNLFVLISQDGTNFEDGSTSVDPPAGAATYVRGLTTGTSAKRVVFRGILIPPTIYKIMIENKDGTAWSTSNTLKLRTYTEQSS